MARRRRDTPASIPLTIEVEGEQHVGSYIVQDGVVTASLPGPPGSSKSTQVGANTASEVARWLLGELIGERQARRR